MLDDLEIIHWVKFIERFELEANSLGACLLFIGMATKLLMNNLRQKEAFEVYLYSKFPVFNTFNQWIMFNNQRFYQDIQDSLRCHQIYLELRQGLYLPFDFEAWHRK